MKLLGAGDSGRSLDALGGIQQLNQQSEQQPGPPTHARIHTTSAPHARPPQGTRVHTHSAACPKEINIYQPTLGLDKVISWSSVGSEVFKISLDTAIKIDVGFVSCCYLQQFHHSNSCSNSFKSSFFSTICLSKINSL